MKNCIILHGSPSKEEYYNRKLLNESNSHWIPWLQSQLIKRDIYTATPEIPFSYNKDWDVWRKEVERYDITPETILVGHSTGAGFFVKYLSVHTNITVHKIFLIAPFLDPFHTTKGFFDNYTIDRNLKKRTKHIMILNSDNDSDEIQQSVVMLNNTIQGIEYREFHNYGHFCFEDTHTSEFPELLKIITDN